MKMTLKNRIAQSLEVLDNSDFQNCMDSNDKIVVFHSSELFGSKLSKRYNDILMNRNAIPRWWRTNSYLSDCSINSALKKALVKVVEYLEWGYSITLGRIHKLMEILNKEAPDFFGENKYHADNEILRQYLRNLNNMRMLCNEMTPFEIYDFSFDMVYDLIDKLSLSKETLCQSLLIMYWIQRECDLIPLAIICDEDKFISALDTNSDDTRDEREKKRDFRLFMRKVLDLHLKLFIKNESKDSKTKLKSCDRILKLIKDNPSHTAKTMASCLGLSVQAVQKQIAILKKDNRLKRIGPDNGGRWKVLEKRELI